MKTNIELVNELKQVVINGMKNTDMFEIELESSLPVSHSHNIVSKFREWVESFEFAESYLYKDLKNGSLLIYNNRAERYVCLNFK